MQTSCASDTDEYRCRHGALTYVRLWTWLLKLSLRGAGDVAGDAAAGGATKGHVAARRRRGVIRTPLDGTRAARTAQRRSAPVVGDEVQCLCGIVRRRTRLAHRPS